MSTSDNPDAWSDPTAPTPDAAYDSPTYGPPTYGSPTYGSPTYGDPTSGRPTRGAPADGDGAAGDGSPSLEKTTSDGTGPSPDPGSAYPPPGGYAPPSGGYAPADGYAPASGGYAPPSGGYAPADGYAPVSGGYTPPGGYAPPSGGYAPPDPVGAGWPATPYPTSPSGPPPGPRRSRGPVVALVVGLVVVVIAAVVGVGYLLLSGDDPKRPPVAVSTGRSTSPAPPTGATTGSPSTSDSPSPSDSSDDPSQVEVPAVTPGFQGVLSPKENVAYDVPTGWEVQSPGTLVGYEDNNGQPTAIIHGVSTYLPDVCPGTSGSNRGNAGFETAGSVDPAQAAQGGVTTFAQGAALNEDGTSSPVTTGPVTDVAVAGGTITAKMATATVTPSESGDCVAPSIAFTAVAFTTPTGSTALFILFLDQGTSDALPAASAQQIVASLRPYTG